MTLAAVVVCAWLLAAPPAWARSAIGATTPPNTRAYIFDELGAHPASLTAEMQIRSWLEDDGYRVTMWSDPTEGTDLLNDHHGITLDNFVRMAGAGVVIINGHGSGASGIPVETFPSTVIGDNRLNAAKDHYVKDEHWSPSWIRVGVGPFGSQQSLSLTPAGITHFFGSKHTGLIFTSGCGSAALAANFNAQAFFGYRGETCSSDQAAAGDMRLFFTRLAGLRGINERDTLEASRAGGYSTGAGIENGSGPKLHGAKPLTLAPAVTRVSPSEGSTITTGHQDVSVRFDTVMDQHTGSKMVTASGCSATATHEKWRTLAVLDLVLDIPKHARGCKITLTAHHPKLRADPPYGWPAELDGNQPDSPQNGAVPNRTDYQWTLHVRGHVKHRPPRPKGIPRCPSIPAPYQVCVVLQGSGTVHLAYPSGETSNGHASWTLEWLATRINAPDARAPEFLKAHSSGTGVYSDSGLPGGLPPCLNEPLSLATATQPQITSATISYSDAAHKSFAIGLDIETPMISGDLTYPCSSDPLVPGPFPFDAEGTVFIPGDFSGDQAHKLEQIGHVEPSWRSVPARSNATKKYSYSFSATNPKNGIVGSLTETDSVTVIT